MADEAPDVNEMSFEDAIRELEAVVLRRVVRRRDDDAVGVAG